jgi:hypothetical protein
MPFSPAFWYISSLSVAISGNNSHEAFIATNSGKPVRDWYLTDLTGRTVHSGHPDAATAPLRLDVSALPAGMYWVRLRFRDGGVAGAKLVKY